MPKTLLTAENIEFIKQNRLIMSATAMARKFGIDKNIVTRFMRNNGISAPKNLQSKWRGEGNKNKTISTPVIDNYLKLNYLTVAVKAIANSIGLSDTFVKTRLRQLKLIIPAEIIENRKLASQIQPGSIPANKGKKQQDYMSAEAIEKTRNTRFKPGNIPFNTFDRDGIISIRNHKNRKAYKYIRIALGKWYPLHQHLWEKVNGRIPKGHCLWFIDQNSLNCSLDNLELITRGENMRRNTIHNYPAEIKESIIALTSLKRKIKKHEKRN